MSALGKGLTAAALGAVLQARGFTVVNQKMDPYLNVDPGTMNPFRHGEVYVTDDGSETDLDLGHYERFTGVPTTNESNTTAGQIFQTVLTKERKGEYLGVDVQMVPHVTDEIKNIIRLNEGKADFALVEVGGTVGEIESAIFYEAIRQFNIEYGRGKCMFVQLTYVPYLKSAGELKTKPAQHAAKELLKTGIQADMIVCRADRDIPDNERKKLAMFTNVQVTNVISCPDSDSIYRVPVTLHKNGMDEAVLRHFGLSAPKPDLKKWSQLADLYVNPPKRVCIGVVGKYVALEDAYKSLNEALVHGGFASKSGVDIDFIDSEGLESLSESELKARLAGCHGILVPGGFGKRGTEGMIRAIQYARENKVPYFGICLGMQLAVIEFSRHVAGLKGAGSTELDGKPKEPVIALMTEWAKGGSKEKRSAEGDMGGTMRLGAYPCRFTPQTKASAVYEGAKEISERHRHRYEFNIGYKETLEKAGLTFAGMSPDGRLAEIVEIEDHPWFVGVQFHPEFTSRPTDPQPLFAAFVQAAVEMMQEKKSDKKAA